MERPPDLDVADATRFLVEQLGHQVVPGSVALVGEGAWSRCFGFTDAADGTEHVIRFGRHVEDFRKDRLAGRWASPALPVPTVTAIGEGPDGWYATSHRARGTDLEALDAESWPRVLPSLWATLDALRAIDPVGTTGWGDWDADGNGRHASWAHQLLAVDTDDARNRGHGWRARLAASPVGIEPFRAGQAALAEVAGTYAGPRHAIHGDLLNRNVLVGGDRIAAVFDWGCARWGDPLYELALLEFWAPWYPHLTAVGIHDAALAHLAAAGADLTDLDDRLRACLLHVGLEHQGYTALIGDHANLLRITAQTTALL